MYYTFNDLVRVNYRLVGDSYIISNKGKANFSSVHTYMLRKNKHLIIDGYNVGYLSVHRDSSDKNIIGYIVANLLIGEQLFYKNIKDFIDMNRNSGNVYWDIEKVVLAEKLPSYYSNKKDMMLSSIGCKFFTFSDMSHSIMNMYEAVSKNSRLQVLE